MKGNATTKGKTIGGQRMTRSKVKVGVLFGGSSCEYEVSLKSAYSVITNLDRRKYEVILIGITRDGRWLRFEGEAEAIRQDLWEGEGRCIPAFFSPSREFKGLLEMREEGISVVPIDVVLPVLHGACGEDGTLQGLLTMADIPYTGCGVLASAAGMDKAVAHQLVKAAGVEVTKSAVFHSRDDLASISQKVWQFQYPLYVKPANGGSSLGMTKVDDPTTLLCAVKLAFEFDSKIVIEEAVPGFEVGCAVLGTEELILGAVDELQLHGMVFDYKEKYNMTKVVHHVPARIDGKTMNRIRGAAVAVYRALECSGIARIDFFLTPEGRIVFNEINTMPGFTTGSRCPKMLMAVGLEFSDILDKLIEAALSGKPQEPSLRERDKKQGGEQKLWQKREAL